MIKNFENVSDVISFVESLQETEIKLVFTKKGRFCYESYAPNVSVEIKNELLQLALNDLIKYADYDLVDYSPIGYKDGTVEKCSIGFVGNYDEIVTSFKDADTVETEIDPDELTFYCIIVRDIISDTSIYFFRRVTKFKKLQSKGVIAAFSGNTLNKMESKMLGLDGMVDMFCVGNQIFIMNHISVERIFKMNEQYSCKASEALNMLRRTKKINNFESFEDDCLSDLRVQKALTKMLQEADNLHHALDNFANIEKTIDMFGLEIETNNSVIIYDNKTQLMDILRIIRDSYYVSLIQERNGIDDGI